MNTFYELDAQGMKLLDSWFYHAPFGDQADRYKFINNRTRDVAGDILTRCPPSAERTLAIRKLQEARMWANAAIALNEVPGDEVAQ